MKNVLLVFGGESYEHDISIVTAFQILKKSRLDNYKLIPLYVSRDGKFFNLVKTFPIAGKTVVFSKILFCMATIVVSLVITSMAVLITGYLSILKTLAVLVVSLVLNLGVICLATRKDLNTANNVEDQDNKTSTNFLIFWGIVLSVIITVVSLVLSICKWITVQKLQV